MRLLSLSLQNIGPFDDAHLDFLSDPEDRPAVSRYGDLYLLPHTIVNGGPCPGWVVDFWRSSLATDEYEIRSLSKQDHRSYLKGALQGTHRNAAVTELICGFDYLRDSRDPRERQAGEVLYEATRKIVEESLLEGGKLVHVQRSTFSGATRRSAAASPTRRSCRRSRR